MTPAAVLFWSALGVLVLLAAVIALPVRLALIAETEPRRRLRLWLVLFGGLTPSLPVVDTERRGQRSRSRSTRKERNRKQRPPRRDRASRMLRAAPSLLRGLLGPVSVGRLRVHCRFGLDDPALTGQTFGLIAPLVYGCRWAWPRVADVRVTPVFDRACLDGEADVAITFVPLRLLPPALRFAWASFGPRR